MRIIDCSSGVCSSDLLQQCRECARGYLGKIVLHDLPSAHGEPLRPCGNEALGDRLADDASMLFREGLQLSRVAADDRGRDLKAITRCQGELAHLALGTLRCADGVHPPGSEEHTSELQSLMRSSYAVLCLIKKTTNTTNY